MSIDQYGSMSAASLTGGCKVFRGRQEGMGRWARSAHCVSLNKSLDTCIMVQGRELRGAGHLESYIPSTLPPNGGTRARNSSQRYTPCRTKPSTAATTNIKTKLTNKQLKRKTQKTTKQKKKPVYSRTNNFL